MYSAASRRRAGVAGAILLMLCLAPVLFAGEDGDSKSHEARKGAEAERVYEPGNGVKAPRLIHYVEPDFSSSSKEAFVEGVVRISLIVQSNGQPRQLEIIKGLNSGEDRRAMEAVTQWRFAPGTKDGEPVNVHMTVEVEFHLL